MTPDAPNLSVIVPTLNEAENIEGIIGKIIAGGKSLAMEIIVVDDASRDETQAIVRRLSQTLPVVLLAREKPKDGLAGAVLAGARAARAGVVLVIDADGSHPPERIPDLALPVIEGKRDMVIGSRYAPGGSTPGWSRKRRLMSRAASACAWPLTDVHDALSGFFAVRRELLAAIPSDAAGFKIALEILVRGGDSLRVGEAPIAFRDRELGQSKMGTGVILTYFRRLLALSGWRESQNSVGPAIAKTLLVWAVDFAVFAACWLFHAGLGAANLMGFVAGAGLNIWLKMAQSETESRRVAFLPRIFFVSLLALFLRSGVLGSGAQALGWPWLAAIVPAILTGWTVLFLGYALFIWPVREQYGEGIRWRVSAIGATVYLLALRIVYLYTLPINRRLAAMPDDAPGAGNQATVALRHAGTMLLGPGRAGYNVPALLCWGIGALAVFKATQRIFDKTTAFRALLLFSVLPVFFVMGAIFSPVSVLMAAWALLLWLMTLGLNLNRRLAAACVLAALVLFWWPGGWLPWWQMPARFSAVVRFIPWQFLLATPVPMLGAARFYARWRREERSAGLWAAGAAGAVCAALAGVHAFWIVFAGGLGILVSGAMWLPLIPFIAAEMPWAGGPTKRWWGPTMYGCAVCYGVYFYWLAFGA